MEKNRRDEIVDAFARISSRKGLDNTTMQDIAAEVGISVGAIYLDFKNKEALIEAYEERVTREYYSEMAKILNQAVSVEQLLHDYMIGSVKVGIKLIHQSQGLFDFMSRDIIKHIKKNIKAKRDQMATARIKTITEILTRGVREGYFAIDDIPQTAYLFFLAFAHFLSPVMMMDEPGTVVKDAEAMFILLLKSIRARSANK